MDNLCGLVFGGIVGFFAGLLCVCFMFEWDDRLTGAAARSWQMALIVGAFGVSGSAGGGAAGIVVRRAVMKGRRENIREGLEFAAGAVGGVFGISVPFTALLAFGW